MDSPVIVDKASEFGEPIDLDRPFRGFPFDDDGFGRRNDIRSHLDDLAARHPEFADHLVGPPWGDVPLRSSFYNRSRDPGKSGRNNCQAYSDEDARSQASGSSAASGASAASSHSETENAGNQQDKYPNHAKANRRSQIPQYGLRNTVDIGQHHHNMENADRGNRGQRSMSAPPENMQPSNPQPYHQQQDQPYHQQQDQPYQQSQPHGQGYATWRRPFNTPQQGQPQQPQQQPQQPQQQPQPQQQKAQQQPQFSSQQKPQPQQQFPSQQKPQPQSNVRHIPIFVEGRDEPVLPRSFDEPSNFRREPSPTQFNRPYFQTRSPFGAHYARQPQQQQPRDEQQRQQKPQHQQQQYPPQQQQQYPQQQQYHHQQQQYPQPQPQPQQQQQPHPQQEQQHSQQPQQQPEPPKPKPIVPKDPLERVALVQKEVDSLAEQVALYTGNSRTAKDYMYLDEMLTRELIKLDDIETEGRDNVRQARKNAIRTIQETISLLESKAPLPSQQVTEEEQQRKREDDVSSNVEQPGQTVPMDVDQRAEEDRSHKEAIPLPPCPSSPTKQPEECKQATEQNLEKSDSNRMVNLQQEPSEAAYKPLEAGKPEVTDEEQYPEQIDQSVEKKQGNAVEENQQATTENKAENVPTEGEKPEGVIAEEKKTENVSTEQKTENTSKKKKKKGAASEEKKNAGENICKEAQSG